MSDQQETNQAGSSATKEDATALGFVAIMGLMFGGAAVLIAALAVGIERSWSGRSSGPGSGAWRRSVAGHAGWLEQDRARRAAWSQARQKWWAGGADPATRPAGPPWTYRVGAGLRRWWARLLVSADRTYRAGSRFGEGFRAGWAAARQARRDGATPWATARTRPGTDRPAPPGGTGDVPADPAPVGNETAPEPPPSIDNKPDEPAAPPHNEPDPTPEPATPAAEPSVSTATPEEGEQPMTAPTTGPVGETHLDHTEADLAAIRAHLARVQELNDQMAGERAALEGTVATATERAAANGATAATQQALDEANAVTSMLGRHLSNVADATSQAEDHTSAAQAGLAPARDAQDTLHSAGARGEFVSTATSD